MGISVWRTNWLIPRFLEKPRSESIWWPYRKPTQVGEERILRRLREPWLRNSAKSHRNFGRRCALERVGTCSRSVPESQWRGGDDCLLKTQASAPILRLTASQRPVFLLNSRLGLFTAALSGLHPNRAPLLPKLRGHFAEFLNESSLDHLRILSSPTCVGLRYGHLSPR